MKPLLNHPQSFSVHFLPFFLSYVQRVDDNHTETFITGYKTIKVGFSIYKVIVISPHGVLQLFIIFSFWSDSPPPPPPPPLLCTL